MNEIATKIILDPPKADVVLVFSASWYVWAFIGLLIVAVIVAFLPKKETPTK
jgi:hypothetical protein